MNRIEKLIEELCPNGVEYKPLGEVGTFSRGGGLQKKDFTEEGIGCIHYGQIYTHYGIWATETKSFVSEEFAAKKRKMLPGDIFIATTSENDEDLGKATAWLGSEEIVTSGDGYVFHHDMNPKFVSYFFNSSLFHQAIERWITGTKVRRVSSTAMSKVLIPYPPLEIQQEIVKILDTFQALEAELEARKKQYKFYRDQLLTFTERERVRWSPLSDIGTWTGGGTPSKRNPEFWSNGTIPWISPKDMGGHEITSSQDLITSAAVKNSSAKMVPEGSILLVTRSSILDHTFPVNQALVDVTINQDLKAVTTDPSILPRFVLYYLRNSSQDILRTVRKTGGSVASLDTRKLFAFPMPIPPLEEQQRIVNILDQFDALVNDLTSGLPAEIEARRKQYEYYRDQLLTFKELAA